jgi:hypothetical protein
MVPSDSLGLSYSHTESRAASASPFNFFLRLHHIDWILAYRSPGFPTHLFQVLRLLVLRQHFEQPRSNLVFRVGPRFMCGVAKCFRAVLGRMSCSYDAWTVGIRWLGLEERTMGESGK